MCFGHMSLQGIELLEGTQAMDAGKSNGFYIMIDMTTLNVQMKITLLAESLMAKLALKWFSTGMR